MFNISHTPLLPSGLSLPTKTGTLDILNQITITSLLGQGSGNTLDSILSTSSVLASAFNLISLFEDEEKTAVSPMFPDVFSARLDLTIYIHSS